MDGKVPAYQTMMPVVIEALQFFNGETKNSKIDNYTFKKLGIDLEHVKKFKAQIKWSRTYLKKFGFITNPKHGYWKLNRKYKSCDVETIKQLIKEKSKEYYSQDFRKKRENIK